MSPTLIKWSLQVVDFTYGGVAERFKAPVLKTGVHFVDREFESRPLRQSNSRAEPFRREFG